MRWLHCILCGHLVRTWNTKTCRNSKLIRTPAHSPACRNQSRQEACSWLHCILCEHLMRLLHCIHCGNSVRTWNTQTCRNSKLTRTPAHSLMLLPVWTNTTKVLHYPFVAICCSSVELSTGTVTLAMDLRNGFEVERIRMPVSHLLHQ